MKDKLTTLIAGPTDRTKVFRFANISEDNYISHLKELANTLYQDISTANIIPDQGVPFDLAMKFREKGGIIVGYVPKGDYENLKDNFQYCDEVKEFDGGWNALNTCLSLRGDLITTIGMSPGTLVEIAYTKYHKKYLGKNIPILLDEKTISRRLNLEIEEEVDLRYFNTPGQLSSILKQIREDKR